MHASLLGFGSSNYIGGLALAPNGSLYLAGGTDSPIFPGGPTLIPAASGIFAFAFRLDWQQVPMGGLPAVACMAQNATVAPAPAAPLLIATLFGSSLGPVDGVQFGIGTDGLVATELAGTRVTVGNIPAPILYAQDQQVNFVVPGGLTGSTTEVCVERAGQRSCLFAYVATFAPGIFPFGRFLAVQNQDGSLNTPDNPATRGSIVVIYGTGFGPYSQGVADGSVARLFLNPLKYPVQALFNNSPACMGGGAICYPGPRVDAAGEVLFAGASPLLVSGVTVFVVKIPGGAYPTPWAGGLQLSVSTGGAPDNFQAATTIPVAIK